AARDRWIQVSARRIDELCERVTELAGEYRALSFRFLAEVQRARDEARSRPLLESFDRCRAQLDDVSGAAWGLRLVPVEPLLHELAQHARELAQAQGKRVRFVVSAGGAQLERRVLDGLEEPLLHLVRNAVDHGLERPADRGAKGDEARLALEAEVEGPHLVLTVTDDGRGIVADDVRRAAAARGVVTAQAAAALSHALALDLIFAHGLSTRTEVSDVSGRGVGLDVVRSAVEALGGAVTVTTEPGRSTRFELVVPATVTHEQALVVQGPAALYALPTRFVRAVVRLAELSVETVAGGRALRWGDEVLPLRSLAAVLGAAPAGEEPWALVVEEQRGRWAFSVPAIVGEVGLVRQPVDQLAAAGGLIGASATLDDGRLVLVLTVPVVVRRAEGVAVMAPRPATAALARRLVLVVDDSPIVRDLVAELLAGAGFETATADGGAAALAAVAGRPPSAVLLDVDMPGMDGFEVLRRIREHEARLPVIMLTTRASAADRRQAVALGANAYLVKSDFQETQLVDTVRQFVEGPDR
ncbi:MAG TPA: response regulator, partial [Polyangia bacterium]